MRVFVVVLLLISSCATSTTVQKDEDGGVIALRDSFGNPIQGDTNRENAMEGARKQMAEHCGGQKAFKIVDQREVPVGAKGSAFSSTATFEWRVTYRCK